MANDKKNKEIIDDFKDLEEFGITRESFLNIQNVNQKTNLKKLKSILKETNILIGENVKTLTDAIVIFENCLTVGRISEINRVKIDRSIMIFKGSLIDLIWNVDKIISDIEYGNLFRDEKQTAELKVIQIVEIINKANNAFDDLNIEGVDFAYDEIERVIETLMQISYLLRVIEAIYENI